MVLAGDIGGTQSRFGVFDGARCVVERRFENAGYEDVDSVLTLFLAGCRGELGLLPIEAACLAVAGAVADDGRTARFTNLPWSVDVVELARRHGLPVPALINDFAAAAIGAVTAEAEGLITLQAGTPLPDSPRLIVGAGTGLGMALALPDAGRWRIVPGEGGHIGFAPTDEVQLALWKYLHGRFGRVSSERVVSGPGIAAIHAFMGGAEVDPALIGPAALNDLASGQTETTAARTLNLFVAAYGAFAGDMALASLSRGGVYLAGGIAAKVLPALQQGSFVRTFNAKAQHTDIARRMPIHVAIDPLLGLRGAAHLALCQIDPLTH